MNRIFVLMVSSFVMLACGGSNGSESSLTDALLSNNAEELSVEEYKIIWTWDSDFTTSQKDKLMSWVQEVYDATMITLGEYQFDVHVIFEKSTSKRPVAFGLASRKEGVNSVRLYVNPEATKEALLDNWIAPHELSHLAIPFVGKKSKWFSEGFATFLSRQTMMEMGYYTQEEFDQLYEDKIAGTLKYYSSNTKTFIEVSDSLMSHHSYGAMYSGSTSFFLMLDYRLRKEKGIRFINILQDYQVCCRLEDRSLKDVIHSFDQIIGEKWCGDLMYDYRYKPSIEVVKQFKW